MSLSSAVGEPIIPIMANSDPNSPNEGDLWYRLDLRQYRAMVNGVKGNLSASSITNSDGTLTISPTTGKVVASLNLANANTWTAAQTFASSNLLLQNPARTFAYTFVGSAIAANQNLTFPLLTTSDTVAVLGLAQTFTSTQTFNTITNCADRITFTAAATASGAVTWIGSDANAGNIILNVPTGKLIGVGLNGVQTVAFGSQVVNVYHTNFADANPSTQLGDGMLKLGVGGASVLDTQIIHSGGFGLGVSTMLVQTPTTNSNTGFGLAPSGTAVNSALVIYANSTLSTNLSFLTIDANWQNASAYSIGSVIAGTGSYYPLIFHVGTTEAFRITITPALQMASNILMNANNIVSDATTGTKIGTATTQKLSFYNSTPIVQPSTAGTATGFTAGSTVATFHSDDTYTGNVGSTAYTINGIVANLKNLGLIAA